MGPPAGIADVWCGVAGCKFTGGNTFLEAHLCSTLALVSEVNLFENKDAGYGADHTCLCADNTWVSRDDWCQGWLYWCLGPDYGRGLFLIFQTSNLEVYHICFSYSFHSHYSFLNLEIVWNSNSCHQKFSLLYFRLPQVSISYLIN